MTVTALGTPVTAEAFVIASEPAPEPAARLCAAVLRTPEPAYPYSMRRWRPPAERCESSAICATVCFDSLVICYAP